MKKAWMASLLAWLCFTGGVARGDAVSIPLIGQTHDVPAIHGYLATPEGPGPFPAVILLPGCGGLAPAVRKREEQWASFFRQLGFVTLLTDSFTPRGWRGCRNRDPNSSITFTHRIVDAYSALAFLSAQPSVDKARVVLEGMSHGGGAVLQALAADDPTGAHGTFAAGIAFYPHCWNFVPARLKAPVLILIGDQDGTTPARYCPPPTDVDATVAYRLKVYAGATHAYDADVPGRYFQGDYREFHRQATADSATQIHQFLTTYMQATQR